MTITIHADRRPDRADRRPDRAGRPIPAGRSRDRSMRRPSDPVSIAKAARELLRARVRAGDDPAKVERLIRARLPEAWELLDHNALVALTRRPPERGCHWCSAFVLAVAAGSDEPTHTESHSALLGAPCSTCVRRQGIDRARRRAREEAHAAAIAAAALPPARFCRTCGGSHRWQPATLTASAASPRAATGLIWTGPQPPEATALIAAATRVARPRRRSIARAAAAGTYRLIQPGRPVAAPGANGGRRTYARP